MEPCIAVVAAYIDSLLLTMVSHLVLVAHARVSTVVNQRSQPVVWVSLVRVATAASRPAHGSLRRSTRCASVLCVFLKKRNYIEQNNLDTHNHAQIHLH